MGTCEFEGSPTTSSGGGEESRALTLDDKTRRELYNLPRWVAPLGGCQKDVDFFFGSAKQLEGSTGGVEVGEGGRRRLSSAKAIVRSAQAKRGLLASGGKAKAPRAPAVDRKLLNFYKKSGSTGHLPDQVGGWVVCPGRGRRPA